MKKLAVWIALLAGAAHAQPPAATSLQTHLDFEDGNLAFQPLGDNAKVSLTREAANVKQGRAALRFDYEVGAAGMNALLRTGQMGEAADLKSFRFWVKADYPTNLVMVLQEENAGRYLALFHAPKNQWQQVELAPSDFVLSSNPEDPKDPNGKLDMDIVTAAAIGDFNQLLAASKDQGLKRILGIKDGRHSLYIDDFWASKQPLVLPPGVNPDSKNIIDAFVRPQLSWLSLGDVLLKRVTEKELADQGRDISVRGRGLQAEYRQQAGALMGLTKLIRPGLLKDMTSLEFTVATDKAMTLVVQLEETSGGKYFTTVQLPAGTTPAEMRLLPELFGVSEDSKDDNKRLDLEQVKQILLIDAAGLFGQPMGDNVLWLSNFRVERPVQ